jgi:hypothetical protein
MFEYKTVSIENINEEAERGWEVVCPAKLSLTLSSYAHKEFQSSDSLSSSNFSVISFLMKREK